MIFFLRGISSSFWLFALWVALRVWEPNFEVSPLPDWTLTVFIFLVLFFISFWFSRRLIKRHLLDQRHILSAIALLVVGAFVWESGLTLYLSGWKGILAMLNWRFVVGIVVEGIGGCVATIYLKKQEKQHLPEGMV